MKKFYLEGYGCSLNIAETEQIAGFLSKNGFVRSADLEKADVLVINTCSVKQVTEQRMLSRIKFLLGNKKSSAKLLVFGCLASAQHGSIARIDGRIVVLDNSLSSLAAELSLPAKEFSPEVPTIKSRELVSIIPVSTGCLGACTYCSARLARKELRSYPVGSIVNSLKLALRGDKVNLPSKEIWLTSQDLGCYGYDINSSLPALLKGLLASKENFRMRLGMMNPNHFMKIKGELLPLFNDVRLYKFLHLPVQSGSDSVLRRMNRRYSVKNFVSCVNFARKSVSNITIATDIIVGFPGESRKDFDATLALLNKVKPDIVNISRFGKRRGTPAEKMLGQVSEDEKKSRSRELTAFCDGLFAQKNVDMLGKEVVCLVSERTKNGFNARTGEYLTVFVKKGFGKFVRARILKVKAHYLEGEVAKILDWVP